MRDFGVKFAKIAKILPRFVFGSRMRVCGMKLSRQDFWAKNFLLERMSVSVFLYARARKCIYRAKKDRYYKSDIVDFAPSDIKSSFFKNFFAQKSWQMEKAAICGKSQYLIPNSDIGNISSI